MSCTVTAEEIARLAAQDLDEARAQEVQAHAASCPECCERLAALRRLDVALGALPRLEPPASAILKARRALAAELRAPAAPEILTLEESAAFLRISLDELEEIVLDLPAFELAGQLRIRRARLIEWVEARERAFTRNRAQSEIARILSDAP